MHLPISLRIHL